MALLVRVLVSAGILFYTRTRVFSLGLERAGREEQGRSWGACAVAPLRGRLSAGKLRQPPTSPYPSFGLGSSTFLEGSDLGSLCDEDCSLGGEHVGH